MDQELYRMQQEAAERVRSMQKRARLYVRDEPDAGPLPSPHRANSSRAAG